MITKPSFLVLLAGVLLVPWIEWTIVTPVVFSECWPCGSDDVGAGRQMRGCGSAADSDTLQSITSLAPGRYDLTLVATTGPRSGKQTSGRLWLRPTSPDDRSPTTGHKALVTNPREVPLMGAVYLDWDSVDAPVMLSDTLAPAPTSHDPVRPGVLVLIQNWEHPTLRQRPVLLIGTLSNRRDEEGWLDGPGVGLNVRQALGGSFRGTWDRWGIVQGGSGYFCADYVGP